MKNSESENISSQKQEDSFEELGDDDSESSQMESPSGVSEEEPISDTEVHQGKVAEYKKNVGTIAGENISKARKQDDSWEELKEVNHLDSGAESSQMDAASEANEEEKSIPEVGPIVDRMENIYFEISGKSTSTIKIDLKKQVLDINLDKDSKIFFRLNISDDNESKSKEIQKVKVKAFPKNPKTAFQSQVPKLKYKNLRKNFKTTFVKKVRRENNAGPGSLRCPICSIPLKMVRWENNAGSGSPRCSICCVPLTMMMRENNAGRGSTCCHICSVPLNMVRCENNAGSGSPCCSICCDQLKKLMRENNAGPSYPQKHRPTSYYVPEILACILLFFAVILCLGYGMVENGKVLK